MSSKKFTGLFACILLLTSNFPVLAQDAELAPDTHVVIFEPQQPYQTPTPITAGTNLNGQTVTLGDIALQQVGTPTVNLQLGGLASPLPGSQSGISSGNPTSGNDWFFVLLFGLLCILVGVIFFIYTRRKYKE